MALTSFLANTLLFCKTASPQTSSDNPTWKEYRLNGCGAAQGSVTRRRFGPADTPFTTLAFKNMDLMFWALDVFAKWHVPPKMHLHGSCKTKFKKSFKLISKFFDVYIAKGGTPFPDLPEWKRYKEKGNFVTWDRLVKDIIDRELNHYEMVRSIIECYGEGTIDMVERFEREVTEKDYSADEADIILSTIHGAKGLE